MEKEVSKVFAIISFAISPIGGVVGVMSAVALVVALVFSPIGYPLNKGVDNKVALYS